jgi:hypothetical protein
MCGWVGAGRASSDGTPSPHAPVQSKPFHINLGGREAGALPVFEWHLQRVGGGGGGARGLRTSVRRTPSVTSAVAASAAAVARALLLAAVRRVGVARCDGWAWDGDGESCGVVAVEAGGEVRYGAGVWCEVGRGTGAGVGLARGSDSDAVADSTDSPSDPSDPSSAREEVHALKDKTNEKEAGRE